MDKIKKTFAELRQKARESAPKRWSRKELSQITLLKGAHQESIAPLLRDCPVRVLASNDVLLRAGESCQSVYLVLSGRLSISDPTSTVPSAHLKAGDSLGETILRDKVVVASTITAVEPTRLLVIERDAAWALIRKSHEVAQNWLAILAGRTRVNIPATTDEEQTASSPSQGLHDEVTGLYNRRWLAMMLPRLITRSSTGNKPLALLLIEIDRFTDYVARHDKATGNLALQGVAQTIILSVRPTDPVISFGEAQFAVVLPDSDVAGACVVGERMRSAISRAGAMAPDENVLHSLTISIGAAQFQPFTDASNFLVAAEAALQLAKTSGGDRVAMQ